MNKKALKNLLNDEINNAAPDMLDDVVKSSYIEKSTEVSAQKILAKKLKGRKIAFIAMSCCLVLALAITGVAVYFTRDRGTTIVSNASYTTVAISNIGGEATACEANENPAVSFSADSEGKIESVRADNAGGSQLLLKIADGQSLIGLALDKGVTLVVDAAARIGYIDVNATAENANATVGIKAVATADVKLSEVMNGVKSSVETYLKQNGIYAYVLDTAYTQEELIAEIKQFDKTVTSIANIAELTAFLAARKPYYEEKIKALSSTYTEEVALFLSYVDTARNSLSELKLYIEGLMDVYPYSLINSMLTACCDYIDTIKGLIDRGVAEIENVYSQVKITVDSLIAAVPSQLADTVTAYISAVPDTVAELGDYISAVAVRHANELYNDNIAAYNTARAEISDEDYLAFTGKFK